MKIVTFHAYIFTMENALVKIFLAVFILFVDQFPKGWCKESKAYFLKFSIMTREVENGQKN